MSLAYILISCFSFAQPGSGPPIEEAGSISSAFRRICTEPLSYAEPAAHPTDFTHHLWLPPASRELRAPELPATFFLARSEALQVGEERLVSSLQEPMRYRPFWHGS